MRIYRIDAFRLVTVFLVMVGHILYFGNLDYSGSILRAFRTALGTGARFAIPLFMIASGFFVGKKILQQPSQSRSLAVKYTGRLFLAYVFWCAVYAIEQPDTFLQMVRENPIILIFQGTRIHLWFLASLILAIWLFALWPFDKAGKSFLIFGAILYGIGLLAGSYKVTPIGFDLHFPTRDGPFFTTIFFAIGATFQGILPKVSMKKAIVITLAGFGLFLLEGLILKVFWAVSLYDNDFLLGSIPFGVGVACLAFGQPDTRFDRLVGTFGQFMLGLYASHMLFIDLFRPLGVYFQTYVWVIVYSILVAGFSLLVCLILRKTPLKFAVL